MCPLCGEMDPDQHSRDADRPRYCFFASRGLRRNAELLHPYHGDEGWNQEVEYGPIVVEKVVQDQPTEPSRTCAWCDEPAFASRLEDDGGPVGARIWECEDHWFDES